MSFYNPRVSFPLDFALRFSFMTHNSSETFQLKHYTLCFEQKEPFKVQFFRLLSALIKIHPILPGINERARSGFIQILNHCLLSRKITLLYFFSSYFIYFGQKEPIGKAQVKFSDLVVGCEFTKFLKSYLKSQVSFKLCITLQCHER